MTVLYMIFAFAIGVGAGFAFFYVRYQYAKEIDALRKNFAEAKDELEQLHVALDEVESENIILKEEAEKVLSDNSDLSRVVAELSKYVYHIKKGGEKARELAKILGVYEEEIDQRVKRIMEGIDKPSSENDEDEDYAQEGARRFF